MYLTRCENSRPSVVNEEVNKNNVKDSNASPFLFLLNDKSGTKSIKRVKHLLSSLDDNLVSIEETESKEHALILCQKAINEGKKYVIAVGGDGTVNSIGSVLIGSNTTLGILPTGSGNGIARHLGISMNQSKALDQILKANTRSIDTLKINDQHAIGFAGLGFDAYVANLFDQYHTRGFSSYVKLTLMAYRSYNSTTIKTNDHPQHEIYSLIFANMSQLGNNAYVNPFCVDNDGYFEMLSIRKPSTAQIPLTTWQLFNKRLNESKLVQYSKHEQVSIQNIDKAYLHIDGEVYGKPENLTIRIKPNSLNVITGTDV
jgi:diacylglycerol kinase (ATP)